MVKKDFIEKIAEETGLNKTIVRLVVEKFLQHVRETLLNFGRIEIRNFGVFNVKKRNPKKGRNLKTGETVEVPGRWKVVFKPSKFFRKMNADGLFEEEQT
jgi:nucleoid DNA-binding protein